MTGTLDIYLRAHGIHKQDVLPITSDMLRDTANDKNITLYFYSPDKSTLTGRAADLIFLWGSQFKNIPHLKYGTDSAPILITDVFETKSSPSDENNYVKTQIPNYRINWNPEGNWITGLMLVSSNKRYKRVWLPETMLQQNSAKQECLRAYLGIRRLTYFDQEGLQSLEQLIKILKNPVSFLGESTKPYNQINIHWTMCREIEHESNVKVDLRNYKKEKNYVETLDREFFKTIANLQQKLDSFKPRASSRSVSFSINPSGRN